jgi:hypothetical protein
MGASQGARQQQYQKVKLCEDLPHIQLGNDVILDDDDGNEVVLINLFKYHVPSTDGKISIKIYF